MDEIEWQNFLDIIKQKNKECQTIRFDLFMAGYYGIDVGEENFRRKIYLKFLHQIGTQEVASLPTIRRWFGLTAYKTPTRQQIFRICLALHLNFDESQDFLVYGIGEPGFQVNDYTEWILMYCIQNRLDYKKYDSLLKEYEHNMDKEEVYNPKDNTDWLWQQFEKIKFLSEQDFLLWMWEHVSVFKGYSKTTWDYFMKYRTVILENIRWECSERLEELLAETQYGAWKKHQIRKGKEEKNIKRYLDRDRKRKKPQITYNLRMSILELTHMVYSDYGADSRLILEVYDDPDNQKKSDLFPRITAKHLSDLLHIPLRSEIVSNVQRAIVRLQKLPQDKECPADICEMIEKYSKGRVSIDNVSEAQQWLVEYEKEGKRRGRMIQRTDLLPLIFCVVWQKYLRTDQKYHKEEAKKQFVTMANATLLACHMAPLNDKYLYDAMLLSCFADNHMYSYSDLFNI